VHEQAGKDLGRLEGLTAASSRPLVTIHSESRLEAEALERQRRPQQVAGEPLEAVAIIGLDGH